MLSNIIKELDSFSDSKRAKFVAGFFKTGPGQYGEGDVFLGLSNPQTKSIADKYDLSLIEIKKLLDSKIHEHRLASLMILVKKFERADEKERRQIFNFYISNSKRVNNWDLVDLSAHKIAGEFLIGKDRKILYKLAESSNLWQRRISIVATWAFIKHSDFKDTFALSEKLISDKHDLMHKAVGWMLREVGKKDQVALEKFLMKNYRKLPRTALRYSIERFSPEKKKFYMAK